MLNTKYHDTIMMQNYEHSFSWGVLGGSTAVSAIPVAHITPTSRGKNLFQSLISGSVSMKIDKQRVYIRQEQ